jgi:hypothetical protein
VCLTPSSPQASKAVDNKNPKLIKLRAEITHAKNTVEKLGKHGLN